MEARRSICLAVCGLALLFASTDAQALPTVDLGYQVQRASSFNSTGQYYNFSNIRYAQPPVGDLRWAAPVAPEGRNTTVNDGTQFGPICPQASPAWSAIGGAFVGAFALGQTNTFNYTKTAAMLPNQTSGRMDGRTSEDCLFLDVFVPKPIFEAANQTGTGKGAPVLVWIYGGGYTGGSKTGSGNPSGLLSTSQKGGSEGLIFVAMNYRLGALGFSAGSTLSVNGTQNAALYDQRFALEWVQDNIAKFGGDPKRVTIMGESAGGGSIMHQITAFGGTKPVPFQQAILQSAAYLPLVSSWKQEQNFQQLLSILNVSSLEEARKLPSSAVISANAQQITNDSSYGNYIYGPSVGGPFTPELPSKLLLQGSYAKDIKVMVAHNTYEGVYFTDPRTGNETVERTNLRGNFPGIQNVVLDYILEDLYPPVYNGSYPYTTALERSIFATTEGIFSCNTVYLDRAYRNNSYAYQFSLPPAIHGQDISYTFYNGGNTTLGFLPLNRTVATVLQELLTSFAMDGVPQSPTWGGYFGRYTNMDLELNLNTTGIEVMKDPLANDRCSWWQQSLYY